MSTPIIPRTPTHRVLALLLVLLCLPLTVRADAAADKDTAPFYFSYFTTGVYTQTPETFRKPTLTVPADYTGTVTYASGNTSIATVDASTGDVTYVGADSEMPNKQKCDLCGDVTITATLTADGNYPERTLEYHIFYCNEKKTIKSMDDWKWLGKNHKTTYNYERDTDVSIFRKTSLDFYQVYLVDVQTDLDFTVENHSSDGNINFCGYIEGNGHTFTMETSGKKDFAPIKSLYGVVKNLRLKGKLAIEQSTFFTHHIVALAYQTYPRRDRDVWGVAHTWPLDFAKPTVIIDGCDSEATYLRLSSASFDRNNSWAGGFVYMQNYAGVLTFNDCLFAWNLDDTEMQCMGGFLAYRDTGAGALTFRNCVADLSHTKPYFISPTRTGYFIALDDETKSEKPLAPTYTNCYYVAAVPVHNNSASPAAPENATKLSSSDVRSGRLTYLLADGRTGDANPWCQTVGTDTLSRIKSIAPRSLEVYYLPTAITRETKKYGWTTILSPVDLSFSRNVTPYVVTSLDETRKKAMICYYKGSYKGMPLLVKTEGAAESYTIPAGYYNRPATNGLLRPAYEARTATDNDRVLIDTYFEKTTDEIPAWSCYLSPASLEYYQLNTLGSEIGMVCRITSNDEWNNFCQNYSGKEVTAYLDANLTLTDKDERMEELKGTFDAQGYCITDSSSTEYVFQKAQGTIKNLRVENKNGDCDIVSTPSGSLSYVDCKAAHALWTKNEGGNTIHYSHTLEHYGNTWKAAYGEEASLTDVTADQIKSGEAAWRLNAGRTGDAAVWKQTIGRDDTPRLLSQESKEVHHAAAGTREAESDKTWTTLFYPADLDLSGVEGLRLYDDFGAANDTLFAYENLTGVLSAGTPAIIQSESASGLPAITLPEVYYNKDAALGDGALVGVYEDTSASALYTLTTTTRTTDEGDANDTETATFARPASGSATLPAWQCYTDFAATVFNDGTVITSKDDWNKFKTRYAGRNANVRLVGDLELTAQDTPMESFKGTFSGTMATITLQDGAPAPFKSAEGTIKQITLTGTPVRDGASALVTAASAALTLEDCRSTVGAFVSTTTNVTLNSCLVMSSDETAPDANTAYIANTATTVTAAQIKSGEVAYRLNAGRTGDEAFWLQTIGTDDAPSLTSFTAEEVFLAADTVHIGTAGWATHFYPVACALPEGVTAYTLDGVGTTEGERVVLLSKVTDGTIPALTPVLLCTLPDDETTEAAQKYTIPMPNFYYNALDIDADNLSTEQRFQLVGIADSLETFDGCYVLQQQTDATGKKHTAFYRVDETVGCPVVPAWKCLLIDINALMEDIEDTGEGEQTRAVRLRLDGGKTTSISAAAAADALNSIMADGTTYDLSGRPADRLQKGKVYIKNGQKFVVK